MTYSKSAEKERVRFRHWPLQRARMVETGRAQEAEDGSGAARAKGRSLKLATGAPVIAPGCNRHISGAAVKAAFREGAVNQGGTTGFLCPRPCIRVQGRGFFIAVFTAREEREA